MSGENPRNTQENFWQKLVKTIEDDDLDGFTHLAITKRNINTPIPSYVKLNPKAAKSHETVYFQISSPTILQYCIMNEQAEMVKYLLDTKNPDTLATCEDGSYNALHIASMVYDTQCLELLLKVKAVQENLCTPIRLQYGNPENRDITTNALHIAVNRGLLKTVLILTDAMPKVAYDENGPVPVHLKPVRVGSYYQDDEEEEEEEGVEEEAEVSGIDINSISTNGTTPLHNSTYLANLNMSYLLCCLGANPEFPKEGTEEETNSSIPKGQTPLQMVEAWDDYKKTTTTDSNGVQIVLAEGESKKKRFLKLYKSVLDPEFNEVPLKSRKQCKILLDQGKFNLYREKAPRVSAMDNLGRLGASANVDNEREDGFSNSNFQQVVDEISLLNEEIRKMNNRMNRFEKSAGKASNDGQKVGDISINQCSICHSSNATLCQNCNKYFCSKCMKKEQHSSECAKA